MLATFYDDTEESMARLSLKTNKDISKQASLSEQVAALFGSSMCTCYLCNLKTVVSSSPSSNIMPSLSSSTSSSSSSPGLITSSSIYTSSPSAVSNPNNDILSQQQQLNGNNLLTIPGNSPTTTATTIGRKVQQHNFEILPNKHNSDFSVMKYTYSTPFSQLSTLKLFNLMNTDCSINFNVDPSQLNTKVPTSSGNKKIFL